MKEPFMTSYTYTLITRIAVACFLLVALYEVFFPDSLLQKYLSGTSDNAALHAVYDRGEAGDLVGSKASAVSILQVAGTSTVTGQRAITAIAVSDFLSGDAQQRLQAVRLTKGQLIAVPGAPYNQALLIDRLLGYIMTAMEPALIDEIFKDPPFKALRVKDDEIASLKNLAKYSISVYPTNAAYFEVGISNAAVIFKNYDKTKIVSTEDLAKSVDSIRAILTTTQGLFDTEERTIAKRPYPEVQASSFYYFQGFLDGSIALVYPQEFPKAQAAFQKFFDYYRTTRTSDGSQNIIIETRVPYADFALATFIDAIYGDARRSDATSYLQNMIDLMKAHPDVHKGTFLAFIHQTALDGVQGTNGRWFSYGRFVRMADIYPPFKQLLNENGWNLP